jgi:nicotinamidase-related amidase
VSDAMALVIVDSGRIGNGTALPGLAAAFRAAGLPLVHAVAPEAPGDAAWELDRDLLDAGGVQTLGRAELAIALRGRSVFDATPLDALLRGLGVDTLVVGGPAPSPGVSSSIAAGELRGYRVLLATDELAVTLGAHLRAA